LTRKIESSCDWMCWKEDVVAYTRQYGKCPMPFLMKDGLMVKIKDPKVVDRRFLDLQK